MTQSYTIRRKSDGLFYNPDRGDLQHSTTPKVYPAKRWALSATRLKKFTPDTHDILEHQVSEGSVVSWDK